MKNADYIRAMDDEELAEFLVVGVPICDEICSVAGWMCENGCGDNERIERFYDWLNKEGWFEVNE